MGKGNYGHKALKKQKAAAKKVAHKQMICDANARHDAQFGANPKIVEYYKDYIQGTGLRQSK
jgi:hypothetical protein